VSNSKGKVWNPTGREQRTAPRNVDGAVRDEDTFVVGDDEDGMSEDEVGTSGTTNGFQTDPPPQYSSSLSEGSSLPLGSHGSTTAVPQNIKGAELNNKDATVSTAEDVKTTSPVKYYIRRGDTLQGISLRYNIDVSPTACCRTLVSNSCILGPHALQS